MLELRKRDEDDLSQLIRTHTIVIRQGAFKVVAPPNEILQIVGAGDLYGPDLSYDAEPLSSVGAKSLMPEVTVCAVSNPLFEHWMLDRRLLLNTVLKSLATRNMSARQAFHWAKKSLRERAILTLWLLRQRWGTRYGQFRMIDLPLTKIDLASLMSTVQESAVRVLSEFREDGLISANGKRIVILDNDRLDRLREEILRADREATEETAEPASSPLRPRDEG